MHTSLGWTSLKSIACFYSNDSVPLYIIVWLFAFWEIYSSICIPLTAWCCYSSATISYRALCCPCSPQSDRWNPQQQYGSRRRSPKYCPGYSPDADQWLKHLKQSLKLGSRRKVNEKNKQLTHAHSRLSLSRWSSRDLLNIATKDLLSD